MRVVVDVSAFALGLVFLRSSARRLVVCTMVEVPRGLMSRSFVTSRHGLVLRPHVTRCLDNAHNSVIAERRLFRFCGYLICLALLFMYVLFSLSTSLPVLPRFLSVISLACMFEISVLVIEHSGSCVALATFSRYLWRNCLCFLDNITSVSLTT